MCLYDIFFVLPLAKKLRRDIIFLPLRTLLNCCYSSSCLGFYLRLFGCIFLGGKNHRSFSAVVGRITEVQTQTMMRKILEFSWFSNTCRLKLRKMQGDGGSCTLYIYIYMFMASNIAMSCITCVTLNWIGCIVILLMEEILHQLISSSSHYLQGFYTSQVVQDFHQQIFRSIATYTSAAKTADVTALGKQPR